MSARLQSGFFVAAHLRLCASKGVVAVLRHRGAQEAGAIFVKVDRLDGTAELYGPAPQSLIGEDGDGRRQFQRITAPGADHPTVEARFARELKFDSDAWLIEIEDGEGRSFLDVVT